MDHVIVLAGGEGKRLEDLARARYGYARPKQFCDFGEGMTLLERTIARATRLVDPDRVVVVTTATHHAEADECLARTPGVRRVEQPRNRDTLPGLILPILSILERDSKARIVVLPSDHAFTDDAAFVRCVRCALADLGRCPFELILLGAKLDAPEDGYGWIVPSMPPVYPPRVSGFWEKPAATELPALIARGALANTFVMVGEAWTFAELILRQSPFWFHAVRDAMDDPDLLARAYDTLPSMSFSEVVLEAALGALRVLPMPAVGWSDVGTPERLERSMAVPVRSVA